MKRIKSKPKKKKEMARNRNVMRRFLKDTTGKTIDCWVCSKKGYILYGKVKVKCSGCMGTGKMIQEVGIGA